MKDLKHISILLIIVLLFSSCAFHSGNITTAPQGADFTHVEQAMGQSKTFKIFGLGGLRRDALVYEARQDLIKNRPLAENEAYANVAIDVKNSFILIYSATKVTVTADVISYENKDESRYSGIYPYVSNERDDLYKSIFVPGDTVFDSYYTPYLIKGYTESGLFIGSTQKNEDFVKQMDWDEAYSYPDRILWNLKAGDVALSIDDEYQSLFSPLDTVLDVDGISSIVITIKNDEAMILPISRKNTALKHSQFQTVSAKKIFSVKQKSYRKLKIGQEVIGSGAKYQVVGFNINVVLVTRGNGLFITFRYESLKE